VVCTTSQAQCTLFTQSDLTAKHLVVPGLWHVAIVNETFN